MLTVATREFTRVRLTNRSTRGSIFLRKVGAVDADNDNPRCEAGIVFILWYRKNILSVVEGRRPFFILLVSCEAFGRNIEFFVATSVVPS